MGVKDGGNWKSKFLVMGNTILVTAKSCEQVWEKRNWDD